MNLTWNRNFSRKIPKFLLGRPKLGKCFYYLQRFRYLIEYSKFFSFPNFCIPNKQASEFQNSEKNSFKISLLLTLINPFLKRKLVKNKYIMFVKYVRIEISNKRYLYTHYTDMFGITFLNIFIFIDREIIKFSNSIIPNKLTLFYLFMHVWAS